MTEDCKLPRDGKGCLRDTCHAECIRLENKQKRLADLDELEKVNVDPVEKWLSKWIAQKRKEILE